MFDSSHESKTVSLMLINAPMKHLNERKFPAEPASGYILSKKAAEKAPVAWEAILVASASHTDPMTLSQTSGDQPLSRRLPVITDLGPFI